MILDGSRISVEALYEIFEKSSNGENNNINANNISPEATMAEKQHYINNYNHKKLDALNAAAIEADE